MCVNASKVYVNNTLQVNLVPHKVKSMTINVNILSETVNECIPYNTLVWVEPLNTGPRNLALRN